MSVTGFARVPLNKVEPGCFVTWNEIPEDKVMLVTRKDGTMYSLRDEKGYSGVLWSQGTEIYHQNPPDRIISNFTKVTELEILEKPENKSEEYIRSRDPNVTPVIGQEVIEKIAKWVDEKPYFEMDKKPVCEFFKHGLKYRPPTRHEKRELAKLETRIMGHGKSRISDEAKELVRGANIVVIDEYDSPVPYSSGSYSGRLLIAIFGSPKTYQIYKENRKSDDILWSVVEKKTPGA